VTTYKIPLTSIGGDLTGKNFIVSAKLTSNDSGILVEAKRWHFDLTSNPSGIVREEGESG
jgi:hypothetical protein